MPEDHTTVQLKAAIAAFEKEHGADAHFKGALEELHRASSAVEQAAPSTSSPGRRAALENAGGAREGSPAEETKETPAQEKAEGDAPSNFTDARAAAMDRLKAA